MGRTSSIDWFLAGFNQTSALRYNLYQWATKKSTSKVSWGTKADFSKSFSGWLYRFRFQFLLSDVRSCKYLKTANTETSLKEATNFRSIPNFPPLASHLFQSVYRVSFKWTASREKYFCPMLQFLSPDANLPPSSPKITTILINEVTLVWIGTVIKQYTKLIHLCITQSKPYRARKFASII